MEYLLERKRELLGNLQDIESRLNPFCMEECILSGRAIPQDKIEEWNSESENKNLDDLCTHGLFWCPICNPFVIDRNVTELDVLSSLGTSRKEVIFASWNDIKCICGKGCCKCPVCDEHDLVKCPLDHQKVMMSEHGYCPSCGVGLDGGSIYEHFLKEYNGNEKEALEAASLYGATPTHGQWGRAIGIYDQYKDCTVGYKCPDCNTCFGEAVKNELFTRQNSDKETRKIAIELFRRLFK